MSGSVAVFCIGVCVGAFLVASVVLIIVGFAIRLDQEMTKDE